MPVDRARELSKRSKDSGSVLACNEKEFCWLWVSVFCG